MSGVKEFIGKVFDNTMNWTNIAVVAMVLLGATIIWALYCYITVRRLEGHVNAVTLRRLEKLFREGGNVNDLIQVLNTKVNDIIMIFFVIARAGVPARHVADHLNYQAYKYINKKRKPKGYGTFMIASLVVCAIITLAYFINAETLDWDNLVFPIVGLAIFVLQFFAAATIYILTRRKIESYWQEFKNLFSSVNNYAEKFWQENEDDYHEFCKKVISLVKSNRQTTHTVEKLINKYALTSASVARPKSVPNAPASEGSIVTSKDAQTGEYVKDIKTMAESTNKQGMEMMNKMMDMMQENMRHYQMMTQNVTQSQMMQYNQLLQPGLQQHMMQNQIMMQNAQLQTMMNSRHMMMATLPVTQQSQYGSAPLPPTDMSPVSSEKIINSTATQRDVMTITPPKFDPSKYEESQMRKDEERRKEKTKLENEIKNLTDQTKKQADELEKKMAEKAIAAAEGKPAALPKLAGKEVTYRPFASLNLDFKKKNPKLYASAKYQAPMVFLIPKREKSKIEQRLESFFNAKVIKYEGLEWEELRQAAE